MFGYHVDALNQNFTVFNSEDFAFFVFIFTSDYLYGVAFFDFHHCYRHLLIILPEPGKQSS